MTKKTFYTIFLTGLPRSGTTWFAEMLSYAPEINYISGEPFNPSVNKELFGLPLQKWFYEATEEDLPLLKNAFTVKWSAKDVVRRYNYLLQNKANWKSYLRPIKHLSFALSNKTVLLKDPLAFFSVPLLEEHLHPKLLFTMRHPAAYVSSALRVGWPMSFDFLNNKSSFFTSFITKYQDQINVFSKSDMYTQLLERHTLVWQIFSDITQHYLQLYPSSTLLKHEDFAANPSTSFHELYNTFGLTYTSRVASKIRIANSSIHSTEVSKEVVHQLNRDSKALVNIWQQRLSEKQKNYIQQQTYEQAACWGYAF